MMTYTTEERNEKQIGLEKLFATLSKIGSFLMKLDTEEKVFLDEAKTKLNLFIAKDNSKTGIGESGLKFSVGLPSQAVIYLDQERGGSFFSAKIKTHKSDTLLTKEYLSNKANLDTITEMNAKIEELFDKMVKIKSEIDDRIQEEIRSVFAI